MLELEPALALTGVGTGREPGTLRTCAGALGPPPMLDPGTRTLLVMGVTWMLRIARKFPLLCVR